MFPQQAVAGEQCFGAPAKEVNEVLLAFAVVVQVDLDVSDRFAITMRKENGDWRIVQGMTAVVTVGESSAEIVARRKSRCRKTEPNHVFSYIWNETES